MPSTHPSPAADPEPAVQPTPDPIEPGSASARPPGRARVWAPIAVAAVVAMVVAVVVPRAQALDLARRTGYYATAACVVLFGWTLYGWGRSERGGLWAWVKGLRPATVALWLACVVCGLVCKPFGYRVVDDEPVLVGTASLMHLTQEAAYVTRGYDVGSGFEPLEVIADKRPLLFPFLVSLVHTFTGYRVENAFAVNAVCFALVLALAAVLGRLLAGEWGGRFALLAFFSIPLLVHQSLGAGFEVLNLVLLLGLCVMAWLYAARPSGERLGALVMLGVLAAQTRYESALFLVFVVLVVTGVAWREKRLPLSVWMPALPLLLVPHLWRMRAFGAERPWEMFSRAGVTEPFSITYIPDNFAHALRFFLGVDGQQADSPLLFVIGFPALLLFAVGLRKRAGCWWRDEPSRLALTVMFAAVAAHFGLMLGYFYGQFDDVAVQRLSLPSHVLWVFAPVAVVAGLARGQAWLRIGTVVLVAYVAVFSLPSVAADRFGYRNSGARRAQWVDHFVKQHVDRPILGVDNLNPLVWLARRVPAVTIEDVRRDPARLARHVALGSFSAVYVSQAFYRNPEDGTWTLVPEDDLGTGIILETVAELPLNPVKLQRISKLVSMDPANPPPPWPGNLPPGRPIWNLDRGQPFLDRWVHSLP